jgi:ferric-dicitrate binding protein FerR (iron transport regulator)
MSNDKTRKLLEKLLSNQFDTLSEREYSYLLKLFEEDSNPIINEWLKSKWEESATAANLASEELDIVLAKIKSQMGKDTIIRTVGGRRFTSRFATVFQRVAAILFIPMAIFAAYMLFSGRLHINSDLARLSNRAVTIQPGIFSKTTSQEYYSPAGTRSKIILKDSTTIWLNSSSRLLVANDYGTQYRRVKLVGQAYFDVTKNSRSPFIVDLAKNMSIKVTGTTFTIGAYEDSKSIETVLISGTVYVNHGDETVKMVPSQKVAVNRGDDQLSITTVADESYKLWKDGILIFKETPMPEVISTLEKWFNVRIHVQASSIMAYRFTARLDNCSLSQVMEYMSYSSPLQYTIKERDVTINQKK